MIPIKHTKNIKMYINFSKMNTMQKCWWCQNVEGESTIQEHARNCLALKWLDQRKSGVLEHRITYRTHRHVRHFINKGWEEIGRKNEERRRNEAVEKQKKRKGNAKSKRKREKEKREHRKKNNEKRSGGRMRRNEKNWGEEGSWTTWRTARRQASSLKKINRLTGVRNGLNVVRVWIKTK